MALKLTNNATSRLGASISTSDTQISVQAGDGSKYPSIDDSSDWFPLTILKADGQLEIVRCTARTDDLLTIERAQEGTSAKSFTAGDRVELRLSVAAIDAKHDETLYHGQCRFIYTNATTCTLVPQDGDGLVINGRQYRVDPAGITLSNSLTAASGQYYVYAQDNGLGGVELGVVTVTAATHSRHTDGVEIITGDQTKTLVGYVSMNASNQFLDSVANRRVVSWFSKRLRWASEIFSGSTSSTSPINVGSGVFAFAWAGDSIQMHGIIVASNTNSATGVFFDIRKNAVAWSVQASCTIPGAQYGTTLPLENVDEGATTERLMAFQMYTSVNGGTGSYSFKYMIGVFI